MFANKLSSRRSMNSKGLGLLFEIGDEVGALHPKH